jgi:hypothetical protein
MTVIAALDDPLTILSANDPADMMTPDDDRANGWASGIRTIMSPRPRKIIRGSGIAADLWAHIPSTPRSRSTGIMEMASICAMVTMVVVMMAGMRSSLGVRSKHNN